MQELVSIITPLYNSQEYIEETIQSILNQNYSNWELIVVDDCSRDESLAIVGEFANKDSRIKIIKLEENSGAAIARNTGIENAKGRYIAFLDSDDLWVPEKLEKQIEFMKGKDISFSFTGYIKIDEDGTEKGQVTIPDVVTYKELLKSNVIGCLTAIYDVEKLGKIYMPNIRKRQDHALWLKILKGHTNAYGLNEPLAKYRIREGSISRNKIKAASYQWKLYREVERLSIGKSLYYFINYAYHGFKKSKI